MTHTPTIARLHELFELLPDGKLVRRITVNNRAKAGDVAGCREKRGYIVVGIDSHLYYAHRVVFAMTHGRWPADKTDHENGERDQNRPGNLRDVTNRQNSQNLAIHRAGHLLGTTFVKRIGRWRAQTRSRCIGYYDTAFEAHAAYCA